MMNEEDEEFNRIEREAAMRQATNQPAPAQEPVLYQFRWTNPSGDNHPGSMMEWKPVEPSWNQTVEQKCAELAAYRYGGKPVYEVRALYATQQVTQHPCKWPTCQSEKVQQALADEIQQELVGSEQPAQPQQKPVAWVMFRQDEDGLEPIMFGGPGTAPDPATLKDRFVLKDVWLSPPAQRTWVGLTAEDRVELWKKNSSIDSFVNATEAKLKEKNT
ncbi:hypothetical protein UFOVP393_82 [uncultured Caudovirales phage]|uniref:Uncharacterized protein n=1 Tax=uncultured Caudovirales phage TaxID=2100421 RepID=A0A6J7X7L6_9CAUD|nr:hypothetical protein UFOVP393_82 [uncultured Caudovirales phage]